MTQIKARKEREVSDKTAKQDNSPPNRGRTQLRSYPFFKLGNLFPANYYLL